MTMLSENTSILPSRDINGTRDSDLPASNYLESIEASISDVAQPHIHSSFCEKETQDMAMDGRDAASVYGDCCIDKDRSETEEAETFPDVQTTDGSRERITASGVGRPKRKDLLETELQSGVGKPTFSITNSEVEPSDMPRDLVLCETHLDQGSAPTSIPKDIFDYSPIRLEDSTFENLAFHEPSHSDTLISANTMDVSDVPGDLNHHHKETWEITPDLKMPDAPVHFGVPRQLGRTTTDHPIGNGDVYVRFQTLILVDVEPQCPDGEVVSPEASSNGSSSAGAEPVVWEMDDMEAGNEPEFMEQDVNQMGEAEPKAMVLDREEDGEVAELGSDEEIGLYLDLELEPDSEDERTAAEDMDSEESESQESSSEESSESDPDWEP
ncbi:uncharacterized protein LOC130139446 [Syzygium oleosum]|uniref:uncharacterized protein LOC130139446 n=1 Tax=Syzygium oleosum TaxID=219896 RepID=UPI0024BA4DCE|nr:uncharacterized protein LOC130139446 [Syzygium oleosum]